MLGRPRTRLGPLKGSPPVVEMPELPPEPVVPKIQSPLCGNEEIDPDWREKFAAALKEHNPVLDS